MREWFLNWKLARKISFLVILMGVCLFATEMMNRQRLYDSYMQKVNEKNAEILSFYSEYISSVFDRIESTTYAIVGDQNLQEELKYIQKNYRKPGYSANLRSANARIKKYFQKEPYFQKFLLKTDVYQFSYGGILEQADTIAEYLKCAEHTDGSMQMIPEEGRLLAVRELRELSEGLYSHIGYILAIIDFDEILGELKSAFVTKESHQVQFAVYSDDICLYNDSEQLKNYRTYEEGRYVTGDKFIVVYTLPGFGYTMVLQDDYSEIQMESRSMEHRALVISFLAVILVVFAGRFLTKMIIGQLEAFVVRMDDFGNGVLFSNEEKAYYQGRTDEIGRLYRHFYQMADNNKKLTDAYLENKMALKEIEFAWMQKQIQPHLLYNTLSTVSWMAYSNGDETTAHIVETLGTMMRAITDQKESLISVEQDLQIVECYIEIQKLRFSSRLQFSVELSEQTRKRMIPKITLQPLVENSVIHGLENMISECFIRIFERTNGDMLEIVVEDNGPGFEKDIFNKENTSNTGAHGLALKNIRTRLQYVFAEQADLRFVKLEDGMQVCVQIPKVPKETNRKV